MVKQRLPVELVYYVFKGVVVCLFRFEYDSRWSGSVLINRTVDQRMLNAVLYDFEYHVKQLYMYVIHKLLFIA